MSDNGNPLLRDDYQVPFDRIEPSHLAEAIERRLEEATQRIEALVQEPTDGYERVVGELDRIGRSVARVWAPISHLNNVNATPEFREAYGAVLPEMTQFWSRLLNNDGLYARLKAYRATPEGMALEGLQARHLDRTLKEFDRAGAGLDDASKARLETIRMELSRLGQLFQENVLDETAAFSKLITDPEGVAGLPESARDRAAALAQAKGTEGWLITLDMPSVQAVLKHAEDRALREEVQKAYLDRCVSGDKDNRPVIEEILRYRTEMSALLGFDSFPNYRLELFMAKSGAQVRSFLDDLIDRTRPYWQKDLDALTTKATEMGLAPMEPWDVSFVMEALKRERFELDDEALRPWFPLPDVQAGLFEVADRLFGLKIEQVPNDAVWHPEVEFFEIRDEEGVLLGSFYTDWFPREEKRQGAWMDSFITGGPAAGGAFDPHLAFIGGNFNPPGQGRPALLNHREVQTLFHEFGHLLHHCTSRVEIPGRAGINVAWDWVEVPSQIMENWTWEKDALDLFAKHFETGERLPEALLDRMLAAKQFMGGWRQMRQLAFANLDLQLHTEFSAEGSVMSFAADTLRPFMPSDRFVERHLLTAFSHLFAGGYAAAYYSYLWSESLEADAFSRFAAEGVLSGDVGRQFLDRILSQGDREDPEVLFRDFMGRDPDSSALVARNLGAA
ncbi:MAG: M3 family metallopeptidase [Longimicrobiales bacterium]